MRSGRLSRAAPPSMYATAARIGASRRRGSGSQPLRCLARVRPERDVAVPALDLLAGVVGVGQDRDAGERPRLLLERAAEIVERVARQPLPGPEAARSA